MVHGGVAMAFKLSSFRTYNGN